MKVLQLTTHFKPNVGGVETHLNDLVRVLIKRGHCVFVLTYRPLVTKTPWKIYEKEDNFQVLRIPWIPGFFYKLVQKPLLEFLYLSPGLFFITPLVLLIKDPEVIHSHGLIAGFAAVFWGRLFKKRVIVTTHSIYHFPKKGLYRKFIKWLFEKANYCLALSNQSAKEIRSLGIEEQKVGIFTYWIDLKKFRKAPKAKKELGWDKKFIVFFVGRLVPEKGIQELLHAARFWNKNIKLAIAGSGPLGKGVQNSVDKSQNLIFLGRIDNKDLPPYYSAADLVIVPSVHEEGFGRVILESLACGTPIVGAKRGAIPEAMDETVGKIINVSPKKIKEAVEYFYKYPDKLNELSKNTRKFAVKRYSEKNVGKIIKAYTEKA